MGRRSPLFGYVICLALLATTVTVRAIDPAPTDAVDFILGAATKPSAPTTVPATTAPSTPFKSKADTAARRGTFTYSDGSTFTGWTTTTLEKPLRIWVEAQGEFIDVPYAHIRSATVDVVWERLDKEYQFLVSGSDIKTFTGLTYPARETIYTFTLKDGRTIKGSIVVPFDVRADNGEERLIVLHKRDKGPAGKTLNDLVYVTKMELGD